jgi:hypothetical protein
VRRVGPPIERVATRIGALTTALGICVALLVGCGGTRIAIHRSAKPIYAVTGCHGVTVERYFAPKHRSVPMMLTRCAGRFDARALLGLTLGESERVAAAHGASVRELKHNGHGPMPTADEQPSRVDVDTTEGIVTRIDRIG